MTKEALGFVLLVLISTGCGGGTTTASSGGTGTGNPPSMNSTSPESGTATSTQKILQHVCTVLVQCNSGMTAESCLAQAWDAPLQAGVFGLPADTYATFAKIREAEEAGQIQPNGDAIQKCLGEIDLLSCSSSGVGAVRDQVTEALTGLAGVLPGGEGSCPAVFK